MAIGETGNQKLAILSKEVDRLIKLEDEYISRIRELEDKVYIYNPRIEVLEENYKNHDKILIRGNGQPSLQEQVRVHGSVLADHLGKIRKLEDGYVDMNATVTRFGLFAERFDETLNKLSGTLDRFDKTISVLSSLVEKLTIKVEINTNEITSIKKDVSVIEDKVDSVDDKSKIDIAILIRQHWEKVILGVIGTTYILSNITTIIEQIQKLFGQ